MSEQNESAVFVRDSQYFIPTQLARGPWSPDAQHGGAPAALLAGLAETAVGDPEMALVRLTMELIRPVPIAPLSVDLTMGRGKSVRRVEMTMKHGEVVVARAIALLQREASVATEATPDGVPFPGPHDCTERLLIKGMAAETSFHYTAMDARVARGSVVEPGPATAWFRLTVPLLEGAGTSPAMAAVAAADFSNGVSWALPFDSFTFVNTDLTVYLHRPPRGEWVAIDSETLVSGTGVGLAHSTLYDEWGRVGMAQQGLIIRPRA